MHDLPRQKLSELINKHGHTLFDDARRLEGLLKDVLRNEHKRETFVLISALREGVAHELRGSTSGMPPAALAAKLRRQLCDNLALDEAASQWSVESWAFALGIEIASPFAAPVKPVALVNTTAGTPAPGVGVDLAAIATQHRFKAQQYQLEAAHAEALAVQMVKEAKTLEAQIEKEAKANAVNKGRLRFLRHSVQELLKLQPQRGDLRRLLEELPDEPELAREFTNSIGMKFVLVEPGEFMMGSNETDSEKPPHMVEITQPFYMGVFPVTQAEYQAVTGTNPSQFNGIARHPVESVCWNDAVAYAQKLSQLRAEMSGGLTYRLPTEAEWEYSCRAGSTGKWCFGNNISLLGGYAWFSRNSASKTHPVGEKKPNAWGLYDMHGNVWEWCSDYSGDYPTVVQTDPRGPATGSSRVKRGGSWSVYAKFCRSAFRLDYLPSYPSNDCGFRLALSPSDQLQHGAEAQHDQIEHFQASTRAAQLRQQAKVNAAIVQREARKIVKNSQDFAAAAQMLEGIDMQWRDAKLYRKICRDRDKVALLDASIQVAVQKREIRPKGELRQKGELYWLRGRVQELLQLQSQRDDMRHLQEVLLDEPNLPSEFTNSIGMRFVLIQPGEFMMGSNELFEKPHAVEITRPFYLGVFTVTQAEYEAVMGVNPSHFRGNARLPVEKVRWDDAVAFCDKLSKLTVEIQCGANYRLPTEAEWEYACRAGSTGKWYFGDNESLFGEYAWFCTNSNMQSHPVGQKQPNAWGLHDMHGNVTEWCQDYYERDAYRRRRGIAKDPIVQYSLSHSRVCRGGGWNDSPAGCGSAFREDRTPRCMEYNRGFRIALSPSGLKGD